MHAAILLLWKLAKLVKSPAKQRYERTLPGVAGRL